MTGSPRRGFGLALAGCLAGAGLSIYAVTRTWSLTVVERPGLPDLRTSGTGVERAPWLIGLALVALAGAGALLATRGVVRRLLGGLLALVGAGVAVGAIVARSGLDVGRAGAGGTFWPVACAAGGALIAVAGLAAARSGASWPVMGSRYERRKVPGVPAEVGGRSGPSPAAGLERGETADSASQPETEVDTRAVWDALDRGDDPTLR